MKKIATLIVITALLLSCKSQQKPIATSETTVVKTKEMLVGKQTKDAFQVSPYVFWYIPNHDNYTPDAATISELKKHTKDLYITVFMGTWCSDSQQHVPAFYKILEQLKFNEDKVNLITVDRTKTTPDHLEKGMDIERVPTFIFYKNGKELHRIVESPIESLEKDMLKILTGQPYKHAYQN